MGHAPPERHGGDAVALSNACGLPGLREHRPADDRAHRVCPGTVVVSPRPGEMRNTKVPCECTVCCHPQAVGDPVDLDTGVDYEPASCSLCGRTDDHRHADADWYEPAPVWDEQDDPCPPIPR